MTKLLTIEELAALLSIPRGTAYDQVARGVIPGRVKIGRLVRVDRAAVEAWIKKGGDKASSPA